MINFRLSDIAGDAFVRAEDVAAVVASVLDQTCSVIHLKSGETFTVDATTAQVIEAMKVDSPTTLDIVRGTVPRR